MELELLEWGDGTIRLSSWDSMHGDDVIFILNEDGTAYRSYYDGEEERQEPVNLVIALRELIQRVE